MARVGKSAQIGVIFGMLILFWHYILVQAGPDIGIRHKAELDIETALGLIGL